MAAELRQDPHAIYVVDVECGLEEDWGEDSVGADVRLHEHNESSHPLQDAGTLVLQDD